MNKYIDTNLKIVLSANVGTNSGRKIFFIRIRGGNLVKSMQIFPNNGRGAFDNFTLAYEIE